ncbi:DUF6119 family protein [Pedobacter roseus]|uniref:TIGR04141 family sporadically distributed protein n=1 Tax=Pedobacter roseus TaxID=336820 RepID=A0A7G9QHW6_9SPHI|nr:DUF6119 family protein [Pedobacter roseus]QNN42941.1 TIGR04141 family sporadically distributed protein [Pedobacter roseus]
MTAIKPTMYLIKESIKDPKQIFKKKSGLKSEEKDGITLFYKNSHPITPDWAHLLASHFTISTNPFKNSSSYAVLVLEVEKRLLAIPLGYGLHLIDLTKTEYNFGLKTALNCIPKEEIRQVDTTTPEINSQKTKKQAVLGSTPEQFGINKQKDILRGIVGKLSKDHELGEALDGKDSLKVGKSIEGFGKLKSLCKKVLTHFASNHYKTDYAWIDNIAMVRDNSLVEKLTKQLAKTLKSAKFEDMFFSPPIYYETIFDCNGFVFSTGDRSRLSNKEALAMPEMLDWKKSVGSEIKGMSFENIDKFKVNILSDKDIKTMDWPLQRCLSWETEINGMKYILSEGSWYEVAPSFFKEIEDFYQGRILDPHDFPLPSKSKIKESDYNEEICTSKSKDRFLFDLGNPKSKALSLGKDKNEICDVFDIEAKTFIHVKMGKTSPSLSHLFRQGSFSGQALKKSETYRKELDRYLTAYGCAPNLITEPYLPSDYKIIFGIVLGKKQTKNIPFFSKVSFKNVAENDLEILGYDCKLTYIVLP